MLRNLLLRLYNGAEDGMHCEGQYPGPSSYNKHCAERSDSRSSITGLCGCEHLLSSLWALKCHEQLLGANHTLTFHNGLTSSSEVPR